MKDGSLRQTSSQNSNGVREIPSFYVYLKQIALLIEQLALFLFYLHGLFPGSEGQNRWSQEGLRKVAQDPHQARVRVLNSSTQW